MKILMNCVLILALALTFCPRSFGQAADCETALSACNADCGKRPIYDRDRGDYLKQSDFKERCERSCSAGVGSCKAQDSENSCNTFDYHCAATCPWKVVDTYADLTVKYSDSFRQCMNACASGALACRPVNKKLPPRKRTGPFNACEEAQGDCYVDCMMNAPTDQSSGAKMEDSNFPDLCAAACAQGVPACKAKSDAATQCDEFVDKCTRACPNSITDENGNEQSNTDSRHLCENACREGKMFCRDILHLPTDEDDIDAIEKESDL